MEQKFNFFEEQKDFIRKYTAFDPDSVLSDDDQIELVDIMDDLLAERGWAAGTSMDYVNDFGRMCDDIITIVSADW